MSIAELCDEGASSLLFVAVRLSTSSGKVRVKNNRRDVVHGTYCRG